MARNWNWIMLPWVPELLVYKGSLHRPPSGSSFRNSSQPLDKTSISLCLFSGLIWTLNSKLNLWLLFKCIYESMCVCMCVYIYIYIYIWLYIPRCVYLLWDYHLAQPINMVFQVRLQRIAKVISGHLQTTSDLHFSFPRWSYLNLTPFCSLLSANDAPVLPRQLKLPSIDAMST